MNVEEVMTREVFSIDKDRKLSDALEAMKKNSVSRLVVVNDSQPAGIITEKDILESLGAGKHGTLLPSSLHISSAMSRELITIREENSLKEASQLMLEKNIRSLPVRGEGIVGIITTTDLIKPLAESSTPVSRIMRSPVITATPTDRAVHARRLLLDNCVGRLVVVEGDTIAGILTQGQLGRAMAAFKKNADTYQANRVRNLMVEDVMDQNAITIEEGSTCGEAAKLMLEKDFSGLPVVREGKLVGIVTKRDLLTLY